MLLFNNPSKNVQLQEIIGNTCMIATKRSKSMFNLKGVSRVGAMSM